MLTAKLIGHDEVAAGQEQEDDAYTDDST